MRVYFVGSTGVGKTWACRLTARKFGFRLLSEVARMENTRNESNFGELRKDIDAASAFQERVFREQIRMEEEAGDNFVSDRAFDNLAYAAQHAECLPKLMALPECREYVDKVAAGLVFFVRPLPFVTADGVRPVSDLDLRAVHCVDGMVKFMLEMWGVRYFPVDPESPKDRWTLIQNVIRLQLAAESRRT